MNFICRILRNRHSLSVVRLKSRPRYAAFRAPGVRIFFNAGGTSRRNSLTLEQTLVILTKIYALLPAAEVLFNTFNVRWINKYPTLLTQIFPRVVMLKTPTVSELVEHVSHADLVVTTDTGACHVATALGINQIRFMTSNELTTQSFVPTYVWFRDIDIRDKDAVNWRDFEDFIKLALAHHSETRNPFYTEGGVTL